MTRRSVKGIASRATRDDDKARQTFARAKDLIAASGGQPLSGKARDSFQNFAANLGIGTDNLTSASGYGFNPVTRNRILLEWMYRGSWLSGVAVDCVADDMTKGGVEHRGEIKPQDIEILDQTAIDLGVWEQLNDLIKWDRLYGGAIAVHMIDGQQLDTPLRPETIGKDSYRGLMVLDRWMIEPDLSHLVQTPGPRFGEPKFYRVTADAPALPNMLIHYTRCIRRDGVRLPYWQRLMENLWGLSIYERLWDRMVAFDSSTQGAAQLVYKAYLRWMKVKGLREIVATGGQPLAGLTAAMAFMKRYQTIEGITLIDGDDDFQEGGASQTFSGLDDILLQMGQQLAGALQTPLVRLFGMSPKGMNATGESDLRTHYDNINRKQERELRVPVTLIHQLIARSKGIVLPPGYAVSFRPLWQLTEGERSEIAERDTNTTLAAEEQGLISHKTALKELRQSSRVTGRWTNITDDDIEAADDKPALRMGESELDHPGDEPNPDLLASDPRAGKEGGAGKEPEAAGEQGEQAGERGGAG